MSIFEKLSCEVSIDLLVLDCSKRIMDLHIDRTLDAGSYKFIKFIPLNNLQLETGLHRTRQPCSNYNWLLQYGHKYSGNKMYICADRRTANRGKYLVSGAMITFGSSYNQPLKYREVIQGIQSLQNCYNLNMRPSMIHLAVDLIHPDEINLHKRVCRSIKAGKKGPPWIMDSSLYFGSPKSSNQLVVYDKSKQLKEKKKQIKPGNISRVEMRMDIHRMNNFITTIEEAGKIDWSYLYRRYFSFHHPKKNLKDLLGKKQTLRPVWELKNIAYKQFQIRPSNFYRDYIRDHKWFSPVVRNALDAFKWDHNVR